ncbi:MAG: ABC transporter ATP-binding protein [Ignavibacteriaceae bacterium]|nr:ABC transporter ATP-binding protein [Ignavibacteriaceae bacterium]
MSNILRTENLTRDYGNNKGAFNINLEIEKGEVIGFIGPNGAGKTTTLNLITTLINSTSGSFSLFENNIKTKNDFLYLSHRIGYLPSEAGIYDNVTAKELLIYASKLYKLKNSKHAFDLAEELKLDLNTPIKKLSLGNKKKVGFIQSQIHDPEFLILDEPTSGLDPLVQKQVLKQILKVKDRNGAVLLSSHNLSEVESICDRIVMIKNGQIIFSGKTKDVLRKTLKRFRIENVSKEQFSKLQNLSSVKKSEYNFDDAIIYAEDTKEIINYLMNTEIYSFFIERPSLEETFIEYY